MVPLIQGEVHVAPDSPPVARDSHDLALDGVQLPDSLGSRARVEVNIESPPLLVRPTHRLQPALIVSMASLIVENVPLESLNQRARPSWAFAL